MSLNSGVTRATGIVADPCSTSPRDVGFAFLWFKRMIVKQRFIGHV
jgi:hypothetical protein